MQKQALFNIAFSRGSGCVNRAPRDAPPQWDSTRITDASLTAQPSVRYLGNLQGLAPIINTRGYELEGPWGLMIGFIVMMFLDNIFG